jgi:hypothetical protein
MPFENSNDIEINVKLDAEQAQAILKQLGGETKKFKDDIEDATTASDLFTTSLKGLATVGAAKAFKSFIDLGDTLGDVQDAFNQASIKAGELSENILSGLADATKGAITNLELMSAASRALELGIPAQQLDDLAFAAQKFADATGGNALENFNQLTTAIKRGSINILDLYGNIENGKLALDAFTQSEAEALKNAASLNDNINRLVTTTRNAAAEVAKFVNENKLLITSFNTLVSIGEAVYEILAGIGRILKTVVGPVFKLVYDEVVRVINALGILAEIVSKLVQGEIGSFKDIGDIIARNTLPEVTKQTKSATTELVSFGKEADKAAKRAKELAEEAKRFATVQEDFGVSLNDIFGKESFVLSGSNGFIDTLRNAIRKAFKSPDVLGEIKKVSEIFTEGIVDPAELSKRLGIVLKEVNLVKPEFEAKVSTSLDDVISGGLREAFTGLGEETSDALAASLIDTFNTAFSALATAISGGEVNIAGIATSLSSTIGTVIGASFGGPEGAFVGASVGSFVGTIIGSIASAFESSDTAGTTARKAADKFFADVFDANRLAVVVGDEVKQITDLVFKGDTPFGGNSDFASGTFDDLLTTLPANVQSSLKGVGAAFEELLGIGEDVAGQLAAVIANNIGGELNNLQLLVEATGQSFESLHDAVVEAFLDGKLSIEEAQIALEGLQQVSEAGIPGAIGAIDQAFRNLQATVTSGKGSRALADAIRDIGVEAQELGIRDFPTLANRLVQVFGFSAQQVTAFFQAMKATGINSLQELANASTEVAIALATNIQAITQGKDPNATPVISSSSSTTTNTGGGFRSPGSSGGKSKAQQAAESQKRQLEQERKKQIQDALKLVQASQEYQNILDGITNGTISQTAANAALNDLYADTYDLIRQLSKAQTEYNNALQKGKATADQAKAVKGLQAALDELTKKTAKATEAANLDFLKAFADNLNIVGFAARELGVTLEDTEEKIVNAFKAGRTSISQANTELEKARDLLTNGIPGATGATTEAFNNLLKGGKNGGAFSLDAFRDIFAEAEEKFLDNLSPARSQQFKTLTSDFEGLKVALQEALNGGPASGESRSAFDERVASLQARFEGARKALNDFYETVPKIGFEDLRSILEETLDPSLVSTFFQGLQSSGINSFEELANASDSVIIGILNRLGELGLPFQETSDEISRLNDEISSLTQDREANIRFNVSTGFADSESENVFNLIFGNAEGINTVITSPTSGTSTEKSEFDELQNLKRIRSTRKLTKSERTRFDQLRRKFR